MDPSGPPREAGGGRSTDGAQAKEERRQYRSPPASPSAKRKRTAGFSADVGATSDAALREVNGRANDQEQATAQVVTEVNGGARDLLAGKAEEREQSMMGDLGKSAGGVHGEQGTGGGASMHASRQNDAEGEKKAGDDEAVDATQPEEGAVGKEGADTTNATGGALANENGNGSGPVTPGIAAHLIEYAPVSYFCESSCKLHSLPLFLQRS